MPYQSSKRGAKSAGNSNLRVKINNSLGKRRKAPLDRDVNQPSGSKKAKGNNKTTSKSVVTPQRKRNVKENLAKADKIDSIRIEEEGLELEVQDDQFGDSDCDGEEQLSKSLLNTDIEDSDSEYVPERGDLSQEMELAGEPSDAMGKLEQFMLANPELMVRINSKREDILEVAAESSEGQVVSKDSGTSNPDNLSSEMNVSKIRACIAEKLRREEKRRMPFEDGQLENPAASKAEETVRAAERAKLLVHRPPGVPKAVNDLWLIGDRFLATALPTLQEWIQEINAGNTKSGNLYMHANYDVIHSFSALSTEDRSPMSRLHNALVELLDQRSTLPKIIIVFFDHAFLRYQDSEIENRESLNWVFKNLERRIDERKDMLSAKCYVPSEPRILLVKMSPKQALLDAAGGAKQRRRHFNRKLDELALKFKRMETLYIDSMRLEDDKLFNMKTGYFTPTGFRVFWQRLDDMVKIWERQTPNSEEPSPYGSFETQVCYPAPRFNPYPNPYKSVKGQARGRGYQRRGGRHGLLF